MARFRLVVDMTFPEADDLPFDQVEAAFRAKFEDVSICETERRECRDCDCAGFGSGIGRPRDHRPSEYPEGVAKARKGFLRSYRERLLKVLRVR